jgi:hypothetical protein
MRNDTPYTGKALDAIVADLTENGVTISYGKLQLSVSLEQIDEVRAKIADVDSSRFPEIISSIVANLDDFAAKFADQKFSKDEADNAMTDFCLLYAIKERLS